MPCLLSVSLCTIEPTQSFVNPSLQVGILSSGDYLNTQGTTRMIVPDQLESLIAFGGKSRGVDKVWVSNEMNSD
jgi:hypothetical protein